MAQICVNVSENVLSRLEEYVLQSGLSKNEIVSDAIENYLDEIEEDAADLKEAQRIAAEIDSGRMETYTLEEVMAEAGLSL